MATDFSKYGAPVQETGTKTDFSKYKNEYGLSHLLILSMTAVGTTRGYYGPVPLGEPTAQTTVKALVVNLDTNQVEWFTTATSSKVIEKPWDEGDKKWPNLTNAVYTSAEESNKLIKTELTTPELVTKN